ncbi:MAG: hypothetical protein KF819_39490, partial [Labilithrix sp.]|nr:hypothetical protein [Labilithrix sp.]
MRTKHVAFIAVLSLATLAAACSSSVDDAESSESAQTDEDMARGALRTLGAKLQNEERSEANCQNCHDPNKMTLKKWAEDYRKTMDFITDESKSADERINFMRRNPDDPTSGFAPAKLGVLTAGTHFSPGATVSEQRHPTLFKQVNVIAKLFAGKADILRQFKADTLMPVEASYDRLSAAEAERLMSWVEKGMPKLEDLLIEEPRPTSCTDDFAGLKDHVRAIKATSWYAVNRDARMPMFACSNDNSLECFNQKHDGKDIFEESRNVEIAKTWATREDNHRILRALDYKTHFWMRTSVDGRFVANGGGPRIDGTGSVIADLAAALDPSGPKTRDIGINASYDPDFFPGGQGFMFQGGGKYCSMSLLKNPATTKISFDEPSCSKLDSVGLYQTVGQVSGDNAISDIFVVNGKFASDNPGLTASDRDLTLTAGPEAAITIRVGF